MRSRNNTYEWRQGTYSFCPVACKKHIKCALPIAKAREWQSSEVTVDNRDFTRFMAADTHTHTYTNAQTITFMYVHIKHKTQCMLPTVTWVSVSSTELESLNVLYYIFFNFVYVCWQLWLELLWLRWCAWRGLNNVARILWCGMTVGQKRRRTW